MTREEIKQVKMTNQEAIEILRDTPIDLRSPREDDIHTLYAKAQMMAIEALQERPKGRWIKDIGIRIDVHTGERWEEIYYNCSKCDYASDWLSSFCPNCGADMR